MRIAMVGHKRVPSREGGIEVVVEELAARMVMHGHSVTCYNRTGTSAEKNTTSSTSTNTVASGSSGCPPSTARALRR